MESTWELIKRKAFTPQDISNQNSRLKKESNLQKTLGAIDLVLIGIGSTIGSGIFVLTGEIAKKYTGPSVILSYLLASLAALVTALCYAEFSVDIPYAGSAFNYIGSVFGEYMSWIGALNFMIEYVLSAAAVSKGVTGYLSTLFTLPSDFFVFIINEYIIIDLVSVIVIVILTLIMLRGIQTSSNLNTIVTSTNIISILLIVLSAIPFFNFDNLSPFIPSEYGLTGVFHGASIAFFSYIGFDVVATLAEEVKCPQRDMPIGITGSVVTCMLLYVIVCFALVSMENYKLIDIMAPFAVSFSEKGIEWISIIVSFGALTGLITALLTTLIGLARILLVLGRNGLLPEHLSKVNNKTMTPVNATIITCIISCLPALIFNIDILASMVSMGTLFVLFLVCLAYIWRRYTHQASNNLSPIALRMSILVISCLVEGFGFQYNAPLWLVITSLAIWCLATFSFWNVPVLYTSVRFKVPAQPLTASLGVLSTVHLMCSLGTAAYIRFGACQFFGTIYYIWLFYKREFKKKDEMYDLINQESLRI